MPAHLPFTLPAGSCDCHAHVFGPYDRFPLAADRSYTPPVNPPWRFLHLLDALGLQRGVIVTASGYDTDHASLLDAFSSHPDRLRGVAVIDDAITEAQLNIMTRNGVRGVRFNLCRHEGQAVYRQRYGPRCTTRACAAARGRHAQIWIHASDPLELGPTLAALSIPFVVDHMGRMSVTRGLKDRGLQYFLSLLADGRAWTKISGADRLSAAGSPYNDVTPMATAMLAANPDQVVWGSDWPHVNYFDAAQTPNDLILFAQAPKWLQEAHLRTRVLVDNLARLYGFDKVLTKTAIFVAIILIPGAHP